MPRGKRLIMSGERAIFLVFACVCILKILCPSHWHWPAHTKRIIVAAPSCGNFANKANKTLKGFLENQSAAHTTHTQMQPERRRYTAMQSQIHCYTVTDTQLHRRRYIYTVDTLAQLQRVFFEVSQKSINWHQLQVSQQPQLAMPQAHVSIAVSPYVSLSVSLSVSARYTRLYS